MRMNRRTLAFSCNVDTVLFQHLGEFTVAALYGSDYLSMQMAISESLALNSQRCLRPLPTGNFSKSDVS
jgi:hypothetical protein